MKQLPLSLHTVYAWEISPQLLEYVTQLCSIQPYTTDSHLIIWRLGFGVNMLQLHQYVHDSVCVRACMCVCVCVCVCVYLVMYSNSTTYFYNLLCLLEKYLMPYMGCHYINCSMQPQFLEMINYCDTSLVGGIFVQVRHAVQEFFSEINNL